MQKISNLRKKLKAQALSVKVSLVVFVSTALIISYMTNQTSKREKLNFKVPFVFSNKIDPKNTFTVGDQLIAEHIYAFLANSSSTKGAIPLFSEIRIDNNSIHLNIIHKPLSKDGKELNYLEICENIKKSINGTQHSNYKDLLKDIKCHDQTITLSFKKLPYNILELLMSTDFAITKMQNEQYIETGPYYIDYISNKMVSLKLNPNYPKHLRANEIKNVTFSSYDSGDTDQFLSQLLTNNQDDIDAAYVYGHSLTQQDLDKIQKSDFRLNRSGIEWLIYLGFSNRIDLKIRHEISNIIDANRDRLQSSAPLGIQAYSIQPSNRHFGINEAEYKSIKENAKKVDSKKKSLKVSTLKEWSKTLLFQEIIKILEDNYQITLLIYERSEMSKIYDESQTDLYISPLGISQGDPLVNYMVFHRYFKSFEKILSKDVINDLSGSENLELLSNKSKEVEINILKERQIVPILHFPSIVLEKKDIGQNADLEWGWGIHAWTYQAL